MALIAEEFTESLADRLHKPEDALSFYWLGQAGFVVNAPNWRILIDPYLSDYLARRYVGKPLTHVRLMTPPLQPEDFSRLDFVLCTHRHGDHMDPETLIRVNKAYPECRFLVPAPELDYAASLGVPPDRLIGAVAEKPISLTSEVTVLSLPAAHEEFKQDALGHHHFVGYILSTANHQIYHSGDTIPFAGLAKRLRELACDVALLPVNGRDNLRKNQAIPGNFTLEEAIELCAEANIKTMIAHHYGMFDFNTVPAEFIDQTASEAREVIQVLRAKTFVRYLFRS